MAVRNQRVGGRKSSGAREGSESLTTLAQSPGRKAEQLLDAVIGAMALRHLPDAWKQRFGLIRVKQVEASGEDSRGIPFGNFLEPSFSFLPVHAPNPYHGFAPAVLK
ncbi:MAG: hypothetical protein WA978_01345 [Sphingopyxis granuli]|uniref:hypothetical protein n=1 Tax=Sphingopyxis granuli TaxID=267128 RepID=UPI003C7133F8